MTGKDKGIILILDTNQILYFLTHYSSICDKYVPKSLVCPSQPIKQTRNILSHKLYYHLQNSKCFILIYNLIQIFMLSRFLNNLSKNRIHLQIINSFSRNNKGFDKFSKKNSKVNKEKSSTNQPSATNSQKKQEKITQNQAKSEKINLKGFENFGIHQVDLPKKQIDQQERKQNNTIQDFDITNSGFNKFRRINPEKLQTKKTKINNNNKVPRIKPIMPRQIQSSKFEKQNQYIPENIDQEIQKMKQLWKKFNQKNGQKHKGSKFHKQNQYTSENIDQELQKMKQQLWNKFNKKTVNTNQNKQTLRNQEIIQQSRKFKHFLSSVSNFQNSYLDYNDKMTQNLDELNFQQLHNLKTYHERVITQLMQLRKQQNSLNVLHQYYKQAENKQLFEECAQKIKTIQYQISLQNENFNEIVKRYEFLKEEDIKQNNFKQKINKYKSEMKSKQKKIKFPKFPFFEYFNQYINNNEFIKRYSHTQRMLILSIAGLILAYYFIQKDQKNFTQVSASFILQSLANGKVRQTQLFTKKIMEYGQQSSVRLQNHRRIRTTNNQFYYCITNQDFQTLWLRSVQYYNKNVPQNIRINIRASQFQIQKDYLHKITSLAGFYLIYVLFIQPFTKMKPGSFKGRARSMDDIMGKQKSRRVTKIINIKFQDVVGMQKAKQQIMEFIDFLKNPQKYNRLGAKIPRGALLTGPPGTGKTMIAKACAGQSQVPFFTISGSQFMEMYVGVGAQRVRSLFQQAKKQSPSIIFIDQIDAIGKKRRSGPGGGGHDERDTTLNQLLVQMDGFNTDSNVIVFAATNQKQVLDPALTRPGRFDRLIEVQLPDLQGRKQIFMVHLKPVVLDLQYQIQEYARKMAVLTPGFSGAEIKNLCNEAAIIAARTSKNNVSLHDFELASQRVIAGVQKKSILITPQTRKTVAYHECGHGVVAWFLQKASPLLKLTIIPRSKGALGFAQYLPNQNRIMSKQNLLDQICVILGGRISEEIFFGKISTGAYDDLQKAYQIAKQIITTHGMSDKLGWLALSETQYVKDYSQYTQTQIDQQLLGIIKSCSQRTRKIIHEKRQLIEKLAQKLLEKETISQGQIEQILGQRPFKGSKQYQQYVKQKRKQFNKKVQIQNLTV